MPLKILADFSAEQEWVLEPGDMLYLPPQYAHDGIAEGECMTCSIGFRAAGRSEIGREVLQRALDAEDAVNADALYRDSAQSATTTPGLVPAALQAFASEAIARLVSEPKALARALGEWLSEPKPQVWFDDGRSLAAGAAVHLDRRTRVLYDEHHVFINGESFRAGGRDAALMRQLADQRRLSANEVRRLGDAATQWLDDWAEAGWLHADEESAP